MRRELERRVAERTAELARSESRIRAIVNALPDLVFVLDGDGRYVEIVTEEERRLYRGAPELWASACTTCCPSRCRRRSSRWCARTIETGTSAGLEYPLEVRTASAGSRLARRRCASTPAERRRASS